MQTAPLRATMMQTYPLFAALVALSAPLSGCGDDNGGATGASNFAYVNPLFQNTASIDASVGGKDVGGVVTSDSGTPNFSWPATNLKHVVCAVFDEPIGVKNNRITNTHRVVWMWHSGLPQGREGNVTWSHGVAHPNTLADPVTLPAGKYYWAVWGLSSQGIPARSSVEKVYVVK